MNLRRKSFSEAAGEVRAHSKQSKKDSKHENKDRRQKVKQCCNGNQGVDVNHLEEGIL